MLEKVKKLKNHLEKLEEKHKELDIRVEELQNDPSVDDITVQKMKKEKLHIKETLAAIKAELDDLEKSIKKA